MLTDGATWEDLAAAEGSIVADRRIIVSRGDPGLQPEQNSGISEHRYLFSFTFLSRI